jgi:hypothetical protein
LTGHSSLRLLSGQPTAHVGRASPTPTGGALNAQQRVGWQPTRFLSDQAEAERAFALAEQLGSINAAAQLAWPSLRKASTRHGLGMPAQNPEAVRQRAMAATHPPAQRAAGQPGP